MTDLVTLAREVLMRDAEADAINDRVGYDASNSLYVENGWSAPALARAVCRTVPALDAVLELHKPVQARMTSNDGVRDVTVCDHCLDPTWPCPTVATITRALEGENR